MIPNEKMIPNEEMKLMLKIFLGSPTSAHLQRIRNLRSTLFAALETRSRDERIGSPSTNPIQFLLNQSNSKNSTKMQETFQLSAEDPEMAQLFSKSLQLNEETDTQKAILEDQELYGEEEKEEGEEDEEQEEDEEEFSFFCDGANTSPIAAEDAFLNGQIKPIYPLFNQDLLLSFSILRMEVECMFEDGG